MREFLFRVASPGPLDPGRVEEAWAQGCEGFGRAYAFAGRKGIAGNLVTFSGSLDTLADAEASLGFLLGLLEDGVWPLMGSVSEGTTRPI